ncbi:type II toxin-antitoxin system CcdA family antitoxin [Paraburkholderia sp. MPAMCS5]|uniref:type II toxin-antitoxin system CcdA family antitoxin n=1 Tax=Paraburkholderia sp. MPAMCS5 TaxID=3112563 RepID=UPI002E17621C
MLTWHATSAVSRKATNVTLPVDVYQRAKELGINFSRACEQALRQAITAEEGRRWALENTEFIKNINDWVEKNGLPLAEYRMF